MTTYLRNMNNQNDDNRSFDLAKRDIYSQKKKREQLARLLSAANGIKPSMFNPLSNVKIKISPKELPQDSAIVRRNVNELATDQRTIYRTSNRRFDGMIPARNVEVKLEDRRNIQLEIQLERQRYEELELEKQNLKDNVFGEKYNPDKLVQRYESHSQKSSARQVERNFEPRFSRSVEIASSSLRSIDENPLTPRSSTIRQNRLSKEELEQLRQFQQKPIPTIIDTEDQTIIRRADIPIDRPSFFGRLPTYTR
jgi:antitoxin component of MazEF toxin-antitoxin module